MVGTQLFKRSEGRCRGLTKFIDLSLKFPLKLLSLLIFRFIDENVILTVVLSESRESVQTLAGVQSRVRGPHKTFERRHFELKLW